MSLSRQEQERQVQALINERPELKGHLEFAQKKGKMVPYFDAKIDYKNTIGVKKSIMENISSKKSLQSPVILLMYLLQNRPWNGKSDKHHTQDYWYNQRGLITASKSEKKIAEDLGLPKRTIQRWKKQLLKDKLMDVILENRECVYVLGQIIDGIEVFFYEVRTR
jgi:hypothetical protein